MSSYGPDSGDFAENKFIANGDDWYYFDETGHVVTGERVINGQHLYSDRNGVQAKGVFVTDVNGNKRHYDTQTDEMVVSQTLTVDGVEYTLGADGVAVANTQDPDE